MNQLIADTIHQQRLIEIKERAFADKENCVMQKISEIRIKALKQERGIDIIDEAIAKMCYEENKHRIVQLAPTTSKL